MSTVAPDGTFMRNEAYVPGSEYQRTVDGIPKFQCQITDKFGSSVLGYATWVGDYIVTPTHVVATANTDHVLLLTRNGAVSVPTDQWRHLEYADVSYLPYEQRTYSPLQLSKGTVYPPGKEVNNLFVTATTSTVFTTGIIREHPTDALYVTYEGSTKPGFSGVPYVSNKKAVAMHLGSNSYGKGIKYSWILIMIYEAENPNQNVRHYSDETEKVFIRESTGSDTYEKLIAQALERMSQGERYFKRAGYRGMDSYLFNNSDGTMMEITPHTRQHMMAFNEYDNDAEMMSGGYRRKRSRKAPSGWGELEELAPVRKGKGKGGKFRYDEPPAFKGKSWVDMMEESDYEEENADDSNQDQPMVSQVKNKKAIKKLGLDNVPQTAMLVPDISRPTVPVYSDYPEVVKTSKNVVSPPDVEAPGKTQTAEEVVIPLRTTTGSLPTPNFNLDHLSNTAAPPLTLAQLGEALPLILESLNSLSNRLQNPRRRRSRKPSAKPSNSCAQE
ncbi:hypothetical protein 1 [Wenzhou sobemo-like virus 2]|uniref:hypothetical protein 1 n=1 Tax=Wenzhou sobemo-like virus 2 TaxID=1923658 RepID=UPI00090C1AA7|nr:hypothetical protein 1 [Wenzhou sobemo-like virus 2]APG75755.1 hypothetical protein 1 [Wenzhou sobemo-like virus 2]